MDIEDIVTEGKCNYRRERNLYNTGKRTIACPYFAIRNTIPDADLVIMPYQSLLHAETRKQLGVEIDNTIVVFDEAHNVFEAVNQMHQCSMPYTGSNGLLEALKCIKGYLEKYYKRLSKNSVEFLFDLLIFTNSLLKYLKTVALSSDFQQTGKAVKISEIILEISNLWNESQTEVIECVPSMSD